VAGLAGRLAARLEPGRPVLGAYAALLFTEDLRVGAALAAVSLCSPQAGACGALSAMLANALARRLPLHPAPLARGAYAVSPLLLGLVLGASTAPPLALAVLLGVGTALTLALHAALEAALGQLLYLPALSLPFAAAHALLRGLAPAGPAAPSGGRWLHGLGALLDQPTGWAGAGVALALGLSSRIGLLLWAVGAATAAAVGAALGASDAVSLGLELNGGLTAVALGGIWFVPQRSGVLLGAAGAALAAVVGLAVPQAGVLPFNVTVLGLLYGLRQRVRDGAPKAVDVPLGSPEAHLLAHQAHVERHGARLAVRVALPFVGRWTVTQGVDGPHTHRGLWKDALDFEVKGPDGKAHAGLGTALADYHCYRLPVLAPADGTVVRVVDDVADNAVGEHHPTDPWGNLVLLQHGPALYSLVCHLSPGSVAVAPGQFVPQGARLGLCGNSGRSFVPHLHLHLQATPTVGAPTVELELHDWIREGAAGQLVRAGVPAVGDAVRPLARQEAVAACFPLRVGQERHFAVTSPDGRVREERVRVALDLLNQGWLVSDAGGRLGFAAQAWQHLATRHDGPMDSALGLLFAAAPRVPFDGAAGLSWEDVLAARHLSPHRWAWLREALEPLWPRPGVRLAFSATPRGEALVVRGRGRLGRDEVETEAVLMPDLGPVALRLRVGRDTWQAHLRRIDEAVAPEEPGAGAVAGDVRAA
jgi:murein DD-endopeptidase MepM/ murein hydrolase activator NlpD